MSKEKKVNKYWNWKSKLGLVAVVGLIGFGGIMLKDRNPDKMVVEPTYKRWLACYGYGSSVERDWEYSILWDTCVTIRTNPDGTETRVMATLDMGLGGEGSVE